MYSFLRRPAWVFLGLFVAGVAFFCIQLGFWQLDRLDERRTANTVTAQRLEALPVLLEIAVDRDATFEVAGEEHAFRRVTMTGTYDPSHEVLARSQVLNGVAGFHVITPFVLADGSALLVNRGWVPLDMDEPPVPAEPPVGTVEEIVVLQATQTRGRFGPTEPADVTLDRIVRVDLERLEGQIPYPIWPVYGLAVESAAGLPVPVELSELTDGPHRAYAIQWFSFVAIAVGGYAALARSTSRRKHRRSVGG
ncbi:MAG: SURF1 family protein [Acidimicrobiia bacterium]|nr:SURF1 family protein [Acidimicrobiia bacterium]